MHACRGKLVGVAQGPNHLIERQPVGFELRWIDDHVVFRHPPTDKLHLRHAADAKESWTQIVAGRFPQLGDVPRLAGKTDPNDRKGREGQAMDRKFSRRGQGTANLG